MTAEEIRALVDDEIRTATRVAGEAVIWDAACEPFLLAQPERRPSGQWLVFGPAYHADFDFYQVVFDEERRAFGLVFRGMSIGYHRSVIHALERMPRIRERIGGTITCPVCGEERPAKGAIGPLKWDPLFAALLRTAKRPYDERFLFVCGVCIAEGRAMRADPARQNHRDGGPRKASCAVCQVLVKFVRLPVSYTPSGRCGVSMFRAIADIDLGQLEDAVPAFVTIVLIPRPYRSRRESCGGSCCRPCSIR